MVYRLIALSDDHPTVNANRINKKNKGRKISYHMKQLLQLTIIIHQLFTTVSSNSVTETCNNKTPILSLQYNSHVHSCMHLT